MFHIIKPEQSVEVATREGNKFNKLKSKILDFPTQIESKKWAFKVLFASIITTFFHPLITNQSTVFRPIKINISNKKPLIHHKLNGLKARPEEQRGF